MLNRIAEGREVDQNFANKFRIKRMGKDRNDVFWQLGKIHGLENLAFVSDDEIEACQGNPQKLQQLVDRVNDSAKPLPPATFDKLIEELHN